MDVGVRSILRRLVQGVLPPRIVRRIQRPIPPHSIRWEFCNIIEPDPQRRLRLNISHEKLEKIHPADLADIVEELGQAERGAIFESLDSEVAAEALSEVDPKMQASILESMEPEKAAEIVEEMSPDEAADVLNELEESASEEILEEMEVAPESDVRELLEFEQDTAGGMMNTEYVTLHETATVEDAMAALRGNEDQLENLNSLFLVDGEGRLTGAVPLARLFVASGATPLASACQRDSDLRRGHRPPGRRHRAFRQVQPAGAAGGGRREAHCGRDHGGRHHLRAEAEVMDPYHAENLAHADHGLPGRPRPGVHHRQRR